MSRKAGRFARAARWIAFAAAVMTLAGGAVALGAVQRHATTTLAPQALGSVTAKCKHGQVALAGGFAAPGWDPSTANGGPAARFDSVLAGKRGVKTTGFNFNDNGPQKLESFVYCGKRARPPKVISKNVEVMPNSFSSVIAKCPQGSQAIAGGFGTDKSVITLTSKRSGKRGWKVVGVNVPDLGGSSGPASLSAYAYCKAPGAKLVTRSKDATVSSDLQTSSAECPNGGKALSGGFDGHVKVAGGQLSAAGALDSVRAMDGHAWTTSAISTSSPNQATITTYAYCRR